jgi:hypothetical protein
VPKPRLFRGRRQRSRVNRCQQIGEAEKEHERQEQERGYEPEQCVSRPMPTNPNASPGITAASAIAPPNHASRVPWNAKRHDGND